MEGIRPLGKVREAQQFGLDGVRHVGRRSLDLQRARSRMEPSIRIIPIQGTRGTKRSTSGEKRVDSREKKVVGKWVRRPFATLYAFVCLD